MDYLDVIEAEAIYILREAAAQFKTPVLLFSGGKDSAVLVHLAKKAFYPGRFPFPLLHIDTGQNFPETLEFRDRLVADERMRLIVRRVQDTLDRGNAVSSDGLSASRNQIQSVTLLESISEFGFDALIGGARRDEEKARAKERVFSVRNAFGGWEPESQRPELWSLYNGHVLPGQNIRIFPLSNWTELDVWKYIEREKIPLPSIYFAHQRRCVRKKNGMLLAEVVNVLEGEPIEKLAVRCRTVGDLTCTGLIESSASTVAEIIAELLLLRTSERGSRLDDQTSDSSMEDRKRQGYF